MADTSSPINDITNKALEVLAEKHQARERALQLSREVVRSSANAIRAVHRNELEQAQTLVRDAGSQVAEAHSLLRDYPDLYFTGYTQDSQKEYTEACAVYAFIAREPLPSPDDLNVETAPYLNGLAEAASELRRYILDSLRRDDDSRCEELMGLMDEVYNVMVVMDFPDALTGGLRRTTDALRAVLERTRGDLTLATRQRRLERLLSKQERE
jgi:translin